MPETIYGIILLAEQLVKDIKKHTDGADNLVSETQTLFTKVEALKQYEEEIAELNTYRFHKPRSALLVAMHHENTYMEQLKGENCELKNALDEHQRAVEMIMCKYREHVTKLINQNKEDRLYSQHIHSSSHVMADRKSNDNLKLQNKICEMASVMKTAIRCDQASSNEYQEQIKDLQMQNNNLRSLIGISKLNFKEDIRYAESSEEETSNEADDEEDEDYVDDEDDDEEVDNEPEVKLTTTSELCQGQFLLQSGGGGGGAIVLTSEPNKPTNKTPPLDYVSQLNADSTSFTTTTTPVAAYPVADQSDTAPSDTETLHGDDDMDVTLGEVENTPEEGEEGGDAGKDCAASVYRAIVAEKLSGHPIEGGAAGDSGDDEYKNNSTPYITAQPYNSTSNNNVVDPECVVQSMYRTRPDLDTIEESADDLVTSTHSVPSEIASATTKTELSGEAAIVSSNQKPDDILPTSRLMNTAANIPVIDVTPSSPNSNVNSEDVTPSSPNSNVNSEDVTPSSPNSNVNSEDVTPSSPNSNVNSEDITPSSPNTSTVDTVLNAESIPTTEEPITDAVPITSAQNPILNAEDAALKALKQTTLVSDIPTIYLIHPDTNIITSASLKNSVPVTQNSTSESPIKDPISSTQSPTTKETVSSI